MVSVTSEALAGRSFQGSAQRSARPDPASQAGNDGFAALVDSNTASTSDNSRHDSQPAPARRSDDSSSTTDARSRDNSKAPDPTSRDSGNSRDDNKVDSNSDAPRKTKSKSKADDQKSSSDTQPAGDKATTQAVPQPDASNTATSRARNAGCRSARQHCAHHGCRGRRSRRPCDGSRRHGRRAAA